jgi:isocitrate dehydrogenase
VQSDKLSELFGSLYIPCRWLIHADQALTEMGHGTTSNSVEGY